MNPPLISHRAEKPLEIADKQSTSVKNAAPQVEVHANSGPAPCPSSSNVYARRDVPPATDIDATKPTVAPERSHVQRMDALQRANDIRTRRAQLKRDLRIQIVPSGSRRYPWHDLYNRGLLRQLVA